MAPTAGKLTTAIPDGLTIGKATADDISAVKQITASAYTKYVSRIGKPPAPMTADWPKLLTTHDVYVLRTPDPAREIVGAVVLVEDAESGSLKINNLVVDPKIQGKGYGKTLMRFAEDEAKMRGRPTLTLFTNVLMYENLVLYPKLGFYETERKEEAGYHRVYYRKDLK